MTAIELCVVGSSRSEKQAYKNGVLQAYENPSLTGDVPMDPNGMITEDGISGKLMQKLIDDRSWQHGCEDTDQNACLVRVTAGALFMVGHNELGVSVRDKVREAN